MVNTRLEINGTNVPIIKDFPISLNYSVTDIRSPENVKSSFSKTIQIPMSKEVNDLFELIFEVNVSLQTFNPNLKSDAVFYKEEIPQFKGSAQVLSIVKKYDGSTIPDHFEINLIGESGDIFLAMGDAYLTDLNYTDLNHAFTSANLNWTPTLGTGYTYPFIDYGFTQGNGFNWKFTDLKPAIFAREYLKRIFAAAGYSWQSNFLDSTFFKRLLIPDVNEGRVKIDPALIANCEFYANLTFNQTWTSFGSVIGNSWFYTYLFPPGNKLDYDDDVNPPFNDPGNVWVVNFTAPLSLSYNLVSNNNIRFYVTPPAGTVSVSGGSTVNFTCEIQRQIPGGWATESQSTQTVYVNSLGNFDFNITVGVSNYYPAGTVLRAAYYYNITTGITFLNAFNNPITTGSSQLNYVQLPNSTFFAKVVNDDLYYGGTVVMKNTVPQNIKQKDFFKSIIQMFNLRVEPDKNNPKLLTIEPHNDFYYSTNQALDWTKKLDISKEIEVIPMGELDSRTYEFQYKSDKDGFNSNYENEFKMTYGKEFINIQNDFIKNTKTTEVIFSGTPSASYPNFNMVVPRFYQQDDLTIPAGIKNIKCNIRILYWSGLKSCYAYNWSVNGSVSIANQYPYAGHVDDPYSPTVDLSFRYPYRIYWILPGQNYTNNSLYNIYWKKFIEEITDKDSKLIKAWFNLNEVDIGKFTFRNLIYCDLGGGGAYYYVNKIIDYNPLERGITQVELLKVKQADPFVPEIIVNESGTGFSLGGNVGGSTGNPYPIVPFEPSFNFQNNVNGPNSFAYGNGNHQQNAIVIGNNNFVG